MVVCCEKINVLKHSESVVGEEETTGRKKEGNSDEKVFYLKLFLCTYESHRNIFYFCSNLFFHAYRV